MTPFLPQPPTPVGVDVAQVINDMLPTLGASSFGDLTWCLADGSEFYQWADEYAKRLAHKCGVFVERDISIDLEIDTAVYDAPDGLIDAIHVSAGGLRLRVSSARELNALDSTWQATEGPVIRYSMDAGPVGTITVYAIPTATGLLAVIFHAFPAAIALGSSTVAVPAPVADYFEFGMLAEARRKQSEGAMPEMAAHFDERVKLYEQVMAKYWGRDE